MKSIWSYPPEKEDIAQKMRMLAWKRGEKSKEFLNLQNKVWSAWKTGYAFLVVGVLLVVTGIPIYFFFGITSGINLSFIAGGNLVIIGQIYFKKASDLLDSY